MEPQIFLDAISCFASRAAQRAWSRAARLRQAARPHCGCGCSPLRPGSDGFRKIRTTSGSPHRRPPPSDQWVGGRIRPGNGPRQPSAPRTLRRIFGHLFQHRCRDRSAFIASRTGAPVDRGLTFPGLSRRGRGSGRCRCLHAIVAQERGPGIAVVDLMACPRLVQRPDLCSAA